MTDKEKTKEQLLDEVSGLRQQLDELKAVASRSEQGEKDAAQKLQFLKTVSDVSSRFVAVSDIDNAITASLKDIGQTTGADRAYVFLLSEDGTTVSNTHEWVRAGVSSEKDNLQDLPIASYAWSVNKLRRGETIHFKDVSSMPEEASAEREILKEQDIKSALFFPMQSGEQALGFMGLDNVKETGGWSKEHFELLRISAKIVSDALLHHRTDMVLIQQTHDIGERNKELNCLYGISQLFEKRELSIEEVAQEAVNLIPQSLQYPEVACARILLNEREYRTENFRETEWKQVGDIKIYGKSHGIVEVYYLEKKTKSNECPFLIEECHLIDGIARLMGRISERKQTEKALLESEAKNRALLNAIPDMKFRIDRYGTFLEFIAAKGNEPILHPDEFIGKKAFEILPAEIAEQTMLHVGQVLKNGDIQIFEYRLPIPFPDGNPHDFEARLVACGEDEVLAIIRDITEKKRAEDKLRLLATSDSLTEVLNRRSGLLTLKQQLQYSKRNKSRLTICYIDINNLKEINDSFGHREGDEVLRTVARILKEGVRESDIVCRLGGDEFLMILPQCSIARAQEAWIRIAARLKALNAIKMNPYKISISRGFAEYEPGNPSSIDEMLIIADFEMYKDKRSKEKG